MTRNDGMTESVNGMSRRGFLTVGLTGIGALGLLSACAPSAPPPAQPTSAPAAAGGAPKTSPTTAPAAAPTAPPVPSGFLSPGTGTPKRGGTITAGSLANEPPHFDPTQASIQVAGMAYEELLFDRADTFDDGEKVPGLAEAWEVSSDGLTYPFHIRKGVRWQNLPPVNGREVTADDIAWNFKYWSTSSTRKSDFAVIDKVTVKDPYTVDVVLKYPFAPFIGNVLTGMVILAHEVQEQDGHFRDHAIGTGPWIFDKWERGNSIRWTANPNYWRMGSDGKPLPYAAVFQWFNFADEAGAVAALRANQLDMFAANPTGLSLENATALKHDRSDLLYQDSLRANSNFAQFNHKKAPWNDVKARQAIALGLDKDDLIVTAFQNDSTRTGFIPVNLAEWAWPVEKVKSKFPYDKAAAQKMLTELGLAGAKIEVMTNTANTAGRLGAQALAGQLQELGLNPNITVPPNLGVGTQMYQNGQYDLASFTNSTSYEVDDWLYRYWSSASTTNLSGYSNPKFDTLVEAERRETDPAKRKAIVDQLQDILFDDMVAVPIAMKAVEHKVVNPRVKNVKVLHNRTIDYAPWWIDG